ncbi:hypothetical protein Clacol_001588 [Clathrus columnatus]|uniref:Nucleolar complex protein 2 homolog n=1 Tax=Clathrus columnatus TaxID=1419009 RepID=A0AAV5A457_9AGAM|nr:hypothetical protein Clacol_001588 [Clathrus columnatus]
MGKKAPKASRKLAAKGGIKRQIQERHKRQKIKKQIDRRKNFKHPKHGPNGKTGNDTEESEEEENVTKSGSKGITVDDVLGGVFMEEDDDVDKSVSENSEGSDEKDDDDDDDDDASFASVDDLSDDDGETHLQELTKLAEKDPEFYKYLQENDKELLEFDPTALDIDDSLEMDEKPDETPILTKAILKTWQKALLEHRSIRALRKLLIAFRSAAHIQDEPETKTRLAWRLDNQSVYKKLIVTSLRYTPVILDHHIPYKTLPNGNFKQPATSKKFTGLTKLLLSHFHNIIRIIESLPKHSSQDEEESGKDVELTILALNESAKLLPYVIGSRKAVKVYLKTCLDLWSSADDNVRIAAFLSVRRLTSSSDGAILDLVLKNTYLTLVRSSKNTTAHTLPHITLMKNTASELYCSSGSDSVAYQHAFGYVRQLAVLLRAGMKTMNKEAYKQVYNWQFVHSVDFWTLVLARACNDEAVQVGGRESELRPLIYPLVQVSIGAIHLSPSTSGKASTLRPLPLETSIRAPAQYLKTRVYAETLGEEATYIFAEWLAIPHVQGSIAFPEITIPISISLRKCIKKSKATKQINSLKTVLERMDETAMSVDEARRKVEFAPRELEKVKDWERDLRHKLGNTPISKIVNVLRKAREKKLKLLEKARDGEDEILDT